MEKKMAWLAINWLAGFLPKSLNFTITIGYTQSTEMELPECTRHFFCSASLRIFFAEIQDAAKKEADVQKIKELLDLLGVVEA